MKKINNLVFGVCWMLLSVVSACETEIEFNGEERVPRLTVSVVAVAGSPLTVDVSASVFFLDRGDEGYTAPLDTVQGRVRVFVNGSQTGLEAERLPETGLFGLRYGCSYEPAPGDRIRIEAAFPGLDAVSAETQVPLIPRFEVTAVSPDNHELALRIQDDASFEKYYSLRVFKTYEDESGAYDLPVIFTSNDVIFHKTSTGLADLFDIGGSEDWQSVQLFSDALFRGKSYTFKIRVQDDEPVFVELGAVTDSFYWYATSFETLRDLGGFTLFVEGVPLYSNVSGGYGVICASAYSSVKIEW
ncbi:MAG: DUF4249 domain-containing protein [Bacteroidales bacterium]|nr:DUF4249 domain-containing protein [Bacteroidales bacterium]